MPDRLVLSFGLWLAGGAAALAQTPAPLPPSQSMIAAPGPSFALALEAAQTALDTCKARGASVSVAVVDSAGVLKVLLAADGAFAKGVVTSVGKAVTAKDFGMPISELAVRIGIDPVLAAKVKANPNYLVGKGGLPLKAGEAVIGGLGVGGVTSANIVTDEECAQAGLDRIKARLK